MRLGLDTLRLPTRKKTQRLPFPARPDLRIAGIGTIPIVFRYSRTFPADHWSDLPAYRPRILVGSHLDLMLLAGKRRANKLDLKSVDHAIFATTRYGERPLQDDLRTVLWRTFGVPVYELFTGAGHELLASECEIHDGWHVESGVAVSIAGEELIFARPRGSKLESGLAGEVTADRCACGRDGVRVGNVRPLGVPAKQPALAVA